MAAAAAAMGLNAVLPSLPSRSSASSSPTSTCTSATASASKSSSASPWNPTIFTPPAMLHQRHTAPATPCKPRDEDDHDSRSWDVSSTCVNPVYRSSTLQQNPSEAIDSKLVRILFASEGNVCRSVYAEAIFTDLLKESGLHDDVECSSKAVEDYNIGEPPDYRAVQVAEEYGLKLREGTVSQRIDCAKDMVEYDLVLVMDRFNASDLMKEVTVHEAVDKRTRYSYKVHRLGEFCSSRLIIDIDDPLYGNMGGPEEIERLRQVYHDLLDSCKGLLELLLRIKLNLTDTETLKQGLSRCLSQMDAIEWLAPPMLQNKQ